MGVFGERVFRGRVSDKSLLDSVLFPRLRVDCVGKRTVYSFDSRYSPISGNSSETLNYTLNQESRSESRNLI